MSMMTLSRARHSRPARTSHRGSSGPKRRRTPCILQGHRSSRIGLEASLSPSRVHGLLSLDVRFEGRQVEIGSTESLMQRNVIAHEAVQHEVLESPFGVTLPATRGTHDTHDRHDTHDMHLGTPKLRLKPRGHLFRHRKPSLVFSSGTRTSSNALRMKKITPTSLADSHACIFISRRS